MIIIQMQVKVFGYHSYNGRSEHVVTQRQVRECGHTKADQGMWLLYKGRSMPWMSAGLMS